MYTRRISIVLMMVFGCDAAAPMDTDGGTTAEATGSSTGEAPGTSSGAATTGTGGESSSETSSSGGPSEDSSEGGEGSETCGTGCETDEPEVVWIAEPAFDLAGGRCIDVLSSGAGGVVASFTTQTGFSGGGGWVSSLDADGELVAEVSLDQRHVSGLERLEGGGFAWADSWANVGLSSVKLDDLEGEWLSADLVAIDDLVRSEEGWAYGTLVGGLIPECRIRLSAGGFIDSPSLPCNDADARWRLRASGDRVVAGWVGQSALARVDGDGELSAYLDYRFQRTMLDFDVAPGGDVWTVGIVRDPNATGPAFGSFVARHDPELGEAPQWEVLEDDDSSYAWTSVVLWEGEPVLLGVDADDRPRVVGLTASGDLRWSLTPDLPSSAILRRADVDAEGRLGICGETSSGPVVVRIDL